MKFKTTFLATALAISIGQAPANDWTINTVIKNETAVFAKLGTVNGDRGYQRANGTSPATGASYTGVSTEATPTHSAGDILKSETTARIFINGHVNEDVALHAELRPALDHAATNNDYKWHQEYTQQDYLRELYIDTNANDFNLRLGKQQVVWGTADGIKLLDIINPTDYREMAQNSMEESRIPVWMLNAEKYLGNGDNIQFVIAQPKENVFAGLNRNIDTGVRANRSTANGSIDTTVNNGTDTGHAFKLLGPDSITGEYNGFLNIAPDLGGVAGRFGGAFNYMVGFGQSAVVSTTKASPQGKTYYDYSIESGNSFQGLAAAMSDVRMHGFTVDAFESMKMGGAATSMTAALANNSMITSAAAATLSSLNFYMLPGGQYSVSSTTPTNWTGFARAVYNTAAAMASSLGYTASGASWTEDFATGSGSVYDSALAFANNLTGSQMLAYGFQPLYNTNLANVTSAQDSAFDYMGNATFLTFDAFSNARSQYKYDMPKNTEFDFAFRHGTQFDNGLNLSTAYAYAYDKNPIINLSWKNDQGQTLTAHRVVLNGSYQIVADNNVVGDGYSGVSAGTNESLVLSNSETDLGSLYGGNATNYGGASGNSAILTFEQTVKRVHNLGAATDYSFDTESFGPIVLRGEFLYQTGGYQPVIDKTLLGIGDLVGALKMEKADRFKYVLGADVNVLTDMMVSGQFIQERNLDFVDGSNRYTTSYANMHLSNGFIKDFENKEFYSLFFSKPFGESGEGRWNNIIMAEEGGGRWNRFDVEYSISDQLIGTFEVNKYWGDANTQFGQLENSSNIQVGFKYIVE